MITTEELNERIVSKLQSIEALFQNKQNQYGDVDPLQNFTAGALLMFNNANMESQFEVLKGYVLKHISHVYNNTIDGEKVGESIDDIVVYFLIASIMHDLKDETEEPNVHEIPLDALQNYIGEKVFVMFPNETGQYYKVIENKDGSAALMFGNTIIMPSYINSINGKIYMLNLK